MIARRVFSEIVADVFSGMLSARICSAFQLIPPELNPASQNQEQDWACPMDPDVRASQPGVCPRCGMKLQLQVPERKEFHVAITHTPAVLMPGKIARLRFHIKDPRTNVAVRDFSLVHEKLIHLFLVSENLEFFAHVHPELQPDGSFVLQTLLPWSGMYRLLADYYPTGSVPQLTLGTLFVAGERHTAKLAPALAPCRAVNLEASLRLEPQQPLAEMENKLFFSLQPNAELQRYLGAWGHMLVASEDLIDLLHLHPFLAGENGLMQFNVIFPRAGLYRVWTQFQRAGQVNTTTFTIPVRSL